MRNTYDLSHYNHVCGNVGRLQTLNVIPIVPGDSIEIDFDGIIRFAPLRKEIVQDAQIDIFYFYRPHRHEYGDQWIDYIKGGVNNTTTFTPQNHTGTSPLSYLGLPQYIAQTPAWLGGAYEAIYNRWFKNPDLPDASMTNLTASNDRKYGALIARLAHEATRPRKTNVTTVNSDADLSNDDAIYNAPVAGTANIDLRQLSIIQGQYKSEIESNWFANRYNDVVENKWGANINTDADERPELVYRHTMNMSGHEVDGTADANLGQYIGKTVGRCDHHVPRKYFDEHGSLWIMAAVRFPFVHTQEASRLLTDTIMSYTETAADPSLFAAQPSQRYYSNAYVLGGSFGDPEYQEPFGQWYRYQNSRIHENFTHIPGYPFLQIGMNNIDEVFYHTDTDYDLVFQTSQLGQWQIHAKPNITALRHIPDPRSSIYAGT